jgi:hypothetical protein
MGQHGRADACGAVFCIFVVADADEALSGVGGILVVGLVLDLNTVSCCLYNV